MSTETGAVLLDGKATALAVRTDVARAVAALRSSGVAPGLTVVLVGEDPASQVYVRNKDRAATQAGFEVRTLRRSATTRQAGIGSGKPLRSRRPKSSSSNASPIRRRVASPTAT